MRCPSLVLILDLYLGLRMFGLDLLQESFETHNQRDHFHNFIAAF